MDEYTQKTKVWLDNRFKNCDEHGIYCAYQPIYGFRQDHSEKGLINRYIRTYQIMQALLHLSFDSLLDVGGAEGYKAYIALQLFGVKVINSDLSEESCKRAEEIFHVKSTCADIHDLPFKNNEFDIVLCSETLEHVAYLHKAIDELVRVASKAVIITVPHEPKEVIDKNIEEETPHAHIHSFDLESFNFLKSQGYHVLSRKMISSLLRIPGVLIEVLPKEYREGTRFPKILINIYNATISILGPTLRKAFGKKTAAFLIQLDTYVCKFTFYYNAILFVILKDKSYCIKEGIQNIEPYRIIDFTVPYHYLKKTETP